jgi:hypothetical protein
MPGARLLTISAGIAVLVIALMIAVWIGAGRQQRTLSAEVDRLIGTSAARPRSTQPGFENLDTVPPVVSRYLRRAVGTRQYIRQVRITQVGTLRTDVHGERWMPFEAEHVVVPPATGFVWNARIRIAPLVHVGVRDALVDGRGAGQVSLFSAFTVRAATDSPEMNSGSLHRYLAEAVWYPTALLPSPNLRWTEIDAARALATVTDRGIAVSLEFRFGGSGEVTGIYTPARWGTFPEGYRRVPWEGHFRDFRERDGVWVPTHGEVGWYVDHRWRAVWSGTVTAFRVEPRGDSGD